MSKNKKKTEKTTTTTTETQDTGNKRNVQQAGSGDKRVTQGPK